MGLSIIIFPLLPRIKLLTFQMTLIGTTLSGQFVGMLAVMLVVGFRSSTLHPIGYPLISQNVSEQHKGTVLGMWGSARSLGEGIAPAFIGGSLLLIRWEWILIIIGAIGLLYAVYLFVMLGTFETRPPEQISIEAETDDRRSVWEIDRRLYVYPILLIFVAFVLQLIATGGTTVFLPEFVTSEYGYSFSILGFAVTPESTASFYYSALLLTAGGIQIWTGKLINRYDSRYVLLGFLVVGAFMLAVLAVFTLSPLVLFVILLVLGGSLWGLNPARDAIISNIAPVDREGRTFGYLWTGAVILSSASPAIVGWIGDTVGLRRAFLFIAGIVTLSSLPILSLLSNKIYLETKKFTREDSD
jgi:MFS family permease